MKLSGWILRVSLMTMVALSLIFTWLIWQNPSRLGRQESSATVKTAPDTAVGKQTEYLLMPTTAYAVESDQKQLLFKPDTAVTGQLHKALRNWRIVKVGAKATLSGAAYTALLQTDQTLQLKYAGPISFKLFDTRYFKHQAVNTPADFQFDRLLIHLADKTPKLTLLNDETHTKREVTLKNASATQVNEVLASVKATSLPVTEKKLNGKWITAFDQSIAVTPYAFLLDQQNANHFVSLLMPSSQGNTVDSREIGNEVIYTLNDRYRMTLNDDDDVVQYEDSNGATKAKQLTATLQAGYKAITKLNLQGVNTMHYAGYDKTNHTVTFRSYAQGLPIFNDVYNGTVEVTNSSNGLAMTFSLNNLTVAIPTKQAAVSLPSTADVLAQLDHAGYSETSVQDIQLGYYWQPQKDNSQVVDLTPTYFVKINNEYKRYTEWLLPSNAAQINRAATQIVQ
ncbi:MAG: two-component system activity regulator YycH [Lactobacillus sp.]|mgnify:CR=1 FL=1|uniref:YycH family regulatory protein n=1 Tax=Lacticaseibacillus suilingensis TaxID=2799577 RepID=A0ABW4BGX7_9LACO|nr:two-component system activity regulator YycH [Lacticaseibacillus suilingensis]MCI1894281.1 two-component system activity regulator YycH [Lactobacillus sp.]MCI1916874.1 two-component system activity regulator YycH [Lactobacillus sp.]MCI1942078.1 two-component system activity regulator YycH [Lactobacillus sp.]MCI1972459.1 two-component system activity regulator YycH [Lactobacillus sp.]MCI2037500.1 two-component system activity regulator YycH [Lactobacillus sp.]